MRAILGPRQLAAIDDLSSQIDFVTPEVGYVEVARHLPEVIKRRARREGTSPDVAELRRQLAQEQLQTLRWRVLPVEEAAYRTREVVAKQRITRDPNDWPYVALALEFGCPIWTEDQDFCGIGIAIWNSRNIYLFGEE